MDFPFGVQVFTVLHVNRQRRSILLIFAESARCFTRRRSSSAKAARSLPFEFCALSSSLFVCSVRSTTCCRLQWEQRKLEAEKRTAACKEEAAKLFAEYQKKRQAKLASS